MSRSTLAALALLLLVLLALPSSSSAAACSLGSSARKLGPTYTTRLVVTRVSCTRGKTLVRSWYRCRKANGGSDGRCRKRVLGYKCSEKRRNVIRTQFDATVTCRSGSRRIVHDYTQFT